MYRRTPPWVFMRQQYRQWPSLGRDASGQKKAAVSLADNATIKFFGGR